jgi:nucleoside-diphosphate-sugar epimerase
MRIAILGATSQIAKDLIVSFTASTSHELVLFARRPLAVEEWLKTRGLAGNYSVVAFEAFNETEHFDAILNFVGVGNPAQAVAMGASIFEATLKYDELALNYLNYHPACRYIFLSSGAAYGANFSQPVDENSCATVAINQLQQQDWYAVAKLHAECRHRALPHLPIVDIRLFNYFSHTQDLTVRFFITDMLRAIKSDEVFMTSSENIMRDYIGPADFYQLASKILCASPVNEVVDCYTLEPVAKFTLLETMKNAFGLKYQISNMSTGVNATGVKINYFSKNKRSGIFEYMPTKSSLQSVLDEANFLLLT